ncbi:hypothetical protein KHA90_15480 [Flavobacterium psychroterrae]|uniref:Hydrolase n=1 Tax=Flavobacterium psychroterrae TaxID=2133767 RepID=A0ABS5PEZ4_9FLAO|nr:carbohydrate binding family 9 domain-containing protein [Flavobacterium psychroterrae]MBS7232420.1 hypothetical protein [Flavobacterium psychroterrae]
MKTLFINVLLVLSTNAFAQIITKDTVKQDTKQISIYTKKTNTAIKIDGNLSESDWEEAPAISNFIQVEPNQGEKPKFKTIVKILYDKQNLYIGAICLDSLGRKGVRVQDFRRDFDYYQNDLFGIALDTYNNKRNATAFQTNPYSAQRDLQVFDDNVYDVDWDALWQTRSVINENGWSCEIAIPWKTLRYPKNVKDTISWGINFVRVARRENETTAYPGFPRSFDTYRMNYAVELKGIEPPKSNTNIQINPYLISQIDRNTQNGNPSESEYKTKFGGEIKWSPNAQSTLDLTFNTDFAQADADRQVNNLSRFSVFFPERRQFFLENAGLFTAGNQNIYIPFFSRKIGLDDFGNPIPIDAGARFTQKTNSYSLGAIYVHQQETERAQASSNSVLLFKKNYGKQNNLGFLVTNKYSETNGVINSFSNSSATITGFNRITDNLNIDFSISGTKTNGENKDDGYAANTSLNYTSNDMGLVWNTGLISEKYNPQLGFVSRNDFFKNYLDVYLNKRKLSWFPKFIRSWEPGVSFDFYQNRNDFKLQEGYIGIYPIFFQFNNGSKIVGTYQLNWQTLTENFSPLGIEIQAGNYKYQAVNFNYRSDQSSKLSITADFTYGGFYNGKNTTYVAGIRYAPIPYFATTLSYEQNEIVGLGIDKQDLTTRLVTPNIRLALNPRLQLNVFYQYNTVDNRSRWNSRLSWEYKPQSFVYLVFNENKTNDFKQDQTIAKISFLKQF